MGVKRQRNELDGPLAEEEAEVKVARVRDVTLRGITHGVVDTRGLEAKRPCLMVGNVFPSWLLCYKLLGFKVTRVLLHYQFLAQDWEDGELGL